MGILSALTKTFFSKERTLWLKQLKQKSVGFANKQNLFRNFTKTQLIKTDISADVRYVKLITKKNIVRQKETKLLKNAMKKAKNVKMLEISTPKNARLEMP